MISVIAFIVGILIGMILTSLLIGYYDIQCEIADDKEDGDGI